MKKRGNYRGPPLMWFSLLRITLPWYVTRAHSLLVPIFGRGPLSVRGPLKTSTFGHAHFWYRAHLESMPTLGWAHFWSRPLSQDLFGGFGPLLSGPIFGKGPLLSGAHLRYWHIFCQGPLFIRANLSVGPTFQSGPPLVWAYFLHRAHLCLGPNFWSGPTFQSEPTFQLGPPFVWGPPFNQGPPCGQPTKSRNGKTRIWNGTQLE